MQKYCMFINQSFLYIFNLYTPNYMTSSFGHGKCHYVSEKNKYMKKFLTVLHDLLRIRFIYSSLFPYDVISWALWKHHFRNRTPQISFFHLLTACEVVASIYYFVVSFSAFKSDNFKIYDSIVSEKRETYLV